MNTGTYSPNNKKGHLLDAFKQLLIKNLIHGNIIGKVGQKQLLYKLLSIFTYFKIN